MAVLKLEVSKAVVLKSEVSKLSCDAEVGGENDGAHAQLGRQTNSEQVTQRKQGKIFEKASRPKKKQNSTKKGKGTSSARDAEDCSSDEENLKRGPNSKNQWVVNLIHLRGTMHEKFFGMKKQDFNQSSDACRKKWKKIYDDYKLDYDVSGVSGNARASKCKWYGLVDSYMHERANVMKHIHGSATNDDPNAIHIDGVEAHGEEVQSTGIPLAALTTSKLVGRRGEKVATQEAIQELPQHSKFLLETLKDNEKQKL